MAPSSPDFDRVIDRRGTWSSKWDKYAGRDILPFWVADMDFAMPEFIREAVLRRLEHPVVGYTRTPDTLAEAFRTWLLRHYDWQVPDSALVWLPGVVTGFNLAARATAVPGGQVVIPTPVYYPFLSVPGNADQTGIQVPLVRDGRRWVMDFDALEAAITPASRIVLLSNPQNPTGRAYTEPELTALAELCLRHDLVLCSDEIHCRLLLDPNAEHVPVASLGPEIAARTISLYAATKTYNIPGLSCGVAVIPDPELRRRFKHAQAGLMPSVGPLEFAASEAAFNDTGPWLPALLDYLRGNHRLLQAVAGDRMTPVEATYLAWLDVRDLELERPGAYFEEHGLGLSDGAAFGGDGFVRFNFACPRSTLEEGLERLQQALDSA
ncbi:MAG: aspartate aminotransferase [Gammaproteobacteria bacterium]|nr:aspartate aminotransferase [Gammaproteobacteria bacterium]|tara:strand:+ start:4624 stop:5763 length:1140 start_codon:yes stop_codon:yes gene_type:complete